jgi:hypothetical protein
LTVLFIAVATAGCSREHDTSVGSLGAGLEPEGREVNLPGGPPAMRDTTARGLLDDEHVMIELFDGRRKSATGRSHGFVGARIIGWTRKGRP